MVVTWKRFVHARMWQTLPQSFHTGTVTAPEETPTSPRTSPNHLRSVSAMLQIHPTSHANAASLRDNMIHKPHHLQTTLALQIAYRRTAHAEMAHQSTEQHHSTVTVPDLTPRSPRTSPWTPLPASVTLPTQASLATVASHQDSIRLKFHLPTIHSSVMVLAKFRTAHARMLPMPPLRTPHGIATAQERTLTLLRTSLTQLTSASAAMLPMPQKDVSAVWLKDNGLLKSTTLLPPIIPSSAKITAWCKIVHART
jgi:hypothetical protein